MERERERKTSLKTKKLKRTVRPKSYQGTYLARRL